MIGILGCMKMLNVLLASVVALGCTGCVVAGYRSGGGFFVWPGLGTLLVIVVVLLLLRRR